MPNRLDNFAYNVVPGYAYLQERRKDKEESEAIKRRARLGVAYTLHNKLGNDHFEEGRKARNSADSAERKLKEHLASLEGRSRVGLRARRKLNELETLAESAKMEEKKRHEQVLKNIKDSILIEKKKVEREFEEAKRKGKPVYGTANGNNTTVARLLKSRGDLGFLGLKAHNGGVKRRPVKRVVKRAVKRPVARVRK
jgi:hypothetical protein